MSVETREREDGKFGRRSLVRAGVWAIPVVSVAAATPAFAVCSGTTNLTGSTMSGSSTQDSNKKGYTVTLTVDLVNSGQASNALTVFASSSIGVDHIASF